MQNPIETPPPQVVLEIKKYMRLASQTHPRQREKSGEVWKPVFFEQVTDKGGKPELTEKGREVLKRAQNADWSIEGIL